MIQKSATEWHIEPHNRMCAPGIIFATEALIQAMGDPVFRQLTEIATLPGIVSAAYALPDACSGYGFPRGGIIAFDPAQGGVIASGGIGFDIGWGVRTLRTNLTVADLLPQLDALADRLHISIPAGASGRLLRLTQRGIDAMLTGGATWGVRMGFGFATDLERVEDQGCIANADPGQVSGLAKTRQRDEMGTLSSGSYVIVHRVAQIYDLRIAKALNIRLDDIQISIHSGSGGLGQQVETDFHERMTTAAGGYGIIFPNRDLVYAPIHSETGQHYLGALRSGFNCALANRQVLAHLVRRSFNRFFPEAELETFCDTSYNSCRLETHLVNGQARTLYVHRKGASRALAPGHPDLPAAWREIGQPTVIGGSINAPAYIAVGTASGQRQAFGSSCHGKGGRILKPTGITGPQYIRDSQERMFAQDGQVMPRLGTLIRGPSLRGVLAKTIPEIRQEVDAVVEAAELAGLTRRVARLEPLIYIKS